MSWRKMVEPILPVAKTNSQLRDHPTEEALRAAAVDLEASFLAEMLKAAKFGEARDAFGGGAGEEQFASFYRAEIAQKLSENGGIGLAEHIFESLKARVET